MLYSSDARRQIGEAAAAGDDGVKLGELLIAAVVAAFGDELAPNVELLQRLSLEPGRRGRVGQSGRRRARFDEAVQRRGRFDSRKRKPRPFERDVAQIKPHRPWLGDLRRFGEIAPRAVPVAENASEGGAGDEAAREVFILPRRAKASTGSSNLATAPLASSRAVSAEAPFARLQREGEIGAAECQSVERDA
jgi:hypothetical protein